MGEIKKNLIYNVTYQILVIILPFITAPYISRVLGAHNVGVYSYTQAFANYFYLFAMLLFGMILRRLKGDFGKFFLPNFLQEYWSL